MTAEPVEDHEEEHTAWCPDTETGPHSWQECTACGWDEHGIFFRTPSPRG